ncbi:hypothetical protein [Foetidibacter luteolus]|uniref:hypothetical protein n=1 Tax=Foetidibacter luteolus TaxID=2608880 RepID=UPI00129B616C|nr:hypothetical protein [Foetidibacter luteolus]
MAKESIFTAVMCKINHNHFYLFLNNYSKLMKAKYLAACFIILLTACNSGAENTNAVDSADVTGKADSASAVTADPYAAQLTAQDTLFEDGSIPTSWDNAGFNNPGGFKQFIIGFKEWVKADNVDSIAAHVQFPLKQAKTPAIFKEKYADLFNAGVKAAVDSQRLDRIFRNFQGASIGDGKIWFTEAKGKYLVTAVNQ